MIGCFEYDGDFENNVKHGEGILKDFKTNNIYNGDLKNGTFEG